MSASTPIPSGWLIRAGLRAAETLDPGGTPVDQITPSLLRLPTDGEFRLVDLELGLELLKDLCYVTVSDGSLYRTATLENVIAMSHLPDALIAVLADWLARQPPLWLHTAVSLDVVADELIPEDDLAAVRRLVPDPSRREALLLAVADKVEASENSVVGALGEEAVVTGCQRLLKEAGHVKKASEVMHVSRISDALGYDVTSPRLTGEDRARMEVKTTRSGDPVFRCFISRNEARVAEADPYWSLVACRTDPEGATEIVGWCPGSRIQPLLPHDQSGVDGAIGRWASVEVLLPPDHLKEGLPL